MRSVEVIATMGFGLLLGLQVARLAKPLLMQARNIPYSRSADVAKILQAPSLTGAIVIPICIRWQKRSLITPTIHCGFCARSSSAG